MTRKWKKWIPLAIAGGLLFVALGGWVVQLLWNWLTPSIFGWHEITFWQALGLLALCRILFGGHGGHRPGWRRRKGGSAEGLSPEERERWRELMRERCGFGGADTPFADARGSAE